MKSLNEQWRAFLADIDYGVDAENAVINYQPAAQVQNDLRVISAKQNWQNSGIQVEAGKSYLIRSKGRFVIRESASESKKVAWPCET